MAGNVLTGGDFGRLAAIGTAASTDRVPIYDASSGELRYVTIDNLKSTSGSGIFTTISASSTSQLTGNVTVGTDASAASVTIHPTTTASGTLKLAATDSSSDVEVTITNADHGQATTVTIPDSGLATSYVPQSTAALTVAEVDGLDGASTANSVASKVAYLNAGGDIVTASNVGAAGTNCTAVEYGDGFNHTTVLTLSSVVGTIGDNAALANGALIYTLPAGACVINSAYMTVGITLTPGTPTTDAPDVGLGTVIGTGVVATLDGTATFEDIITGQTAADIAGTATVKTAVPTAGTGGLAIETGDAHTVHFNYADTWADVDNTAATISGTVVLNWSFMA